MLGHRRCSHVNPTFVAAPPLPKRGASTTDGAMLLIDDAPDAATRQRSAGKVQGQSPDKKAVQFDGRQRVAARNLLLPATRLEKKQLLPLFFFLPLAFRMEIEAKR